MNRQIKHRGLRARISFWIAACLLAAAPSVAGAQVTLNYTGNNFTNTSLSGDTTPPDVHTTSDRVTVELTLPAHLSPNLSNAPVSPLTLVIRDGVGELTLTNDVETYRKILFSTDSRGNITNWSILLSNYRGGPGDRSFDIETNFYTDAGGAKLEYDRGGQALCGPTSPSGQCANFGTPNYFGGAIVSQNPGVWTGVVPLPDIAPTAVAGDDQSVRVLGAAVTLDGTASFDDNTASNELQYAWQLTGKPAGSAAALTGANTAMPSFVVDVSGTYTASLVVTDSIGQMSAADETMVSTANLAPTANAGPDRVGLVNDLIVLDGSGSTDPEGMMLNYAWSLVNVPAGSNAVLVNTNSVSPNLIPDRAGLYGVSLVVSDNLGPSDPDAAEITVLARSDFASMKIACAAELIADLPESAVKTKGNQNALLNYLGAAAKAVQRPDYEKAVERIEFTLKRTDGCFVNGVADGNGVGRDWVDECGAQLEIYRCLDQARTALQP